MGAWDNWLKLDLGGSIIHRKWDKNDKKRLKNWRDHLISHTQALYNQFYKSTTPFHSFWGCFQMLQIWSGKKWYKIDRLPLQGIYGPPNGVRGPYTLFYKSTSPFYRTIPHLHSFWPSFYFQMQQIRSEKISGKNSFKMIQNSSISPYRVFKGPQRVTHRWGPHLPLIWAQLCQDWSRAWARLINLNLGGSIIQKMR